MMEPFGLTGLFLVVLTALYWIAEREELPACAYCGRASESPWHFACAGLGCRHPGAHHGYQAPQWPYALLAAAMVADLAARLLSGGAA
jgi:hypothetical protein